MIRFLKLKTNTLNVLLVIFCRHFICDDLRFDHALLVFLIESLVVINYVFESKIMFDTSLRRVTKEYCENSIFSRVCFGKKKKHLKSSLTKPTVETDTAFTVP